MQPQHQHQQPHQQQSLITFPSEQNNGNEHYHGNEYNNHSDNPNPNNTNDPHDLAYRQAQQDAAAEAMLANPFCSQVSASTADAYAQTFAEPLLPSIDAIKGNLSVNAPESWCEARRSYTQTLIDMLTPIVYDTLSSIYRDAVQLTSRKTPTDIQKTFVDFLREVRIWNIEIVNGEASTIMKACPWFTTLLKGVYVTNMMVLSHAQLRKPNSDRKVRLQVPTCQTFVQTLYSTVAELFFFNPHLFRHDLPEEQQVQNRLVAIGVIRTAIEQAIRKLIPFKYVIERSINFVGNNAVVTTLDPPKAQNHSRGPRRELSNVRPTLQPQQQVQAPQPSTQEQLPRRSPVQSVLPSTAVDHVPRLSSISVGGVRRLSHPQQQTSIIPAANPQQQQPSQRTSTVQGHGGNADNASQRNPSQRRSNVQSERDTRGQQPEQHRASGTRSSQIIPSDTARLSAATVQKLEHEDFITLDLGGGQNRVSINEKGGTIALMDDDDDVYDDTDIRNDRDSNTRDIRDNTPVRSSRGSGDTRRTRPPGSTQERQPSREQQQRHHQRARRSAATLRQPSEQQVQDERRSVPRTRPTRRLVRTRPPHARQYAQEQRQERRHRPRPRDHHQRQRRSQEGRPSHPPQRRSHVSREGSTYVHPRFSRQPPPIPPHPSRSSLPSRDYDNSANNRDDNDANDDFEFQTMFNENDRDEESGDESSDGDQW